MDKPFIQSLNMILIYLPFSLPFKVKEARFRYIAFSHFSLEQKKDQIVRWSNPNTTDDDEYLSDPTSSIKIADVRNDGKSVF